MASAVVSGIPLRAAPLQLSTPQDRQVSAREVHGAVNCLVQKSNLGTPFPATTIRRRARHSPSNKASDDRVNKFKVTAGAESGGDLEGEESEGRSVKQSAVNSNSLHRRELLWAATGTFSYLSSAGITQSAPIPPSDMDITHCSPVDLRTPGQFEHCCLPDGSKLRAIKFKFENLPMRTRKPAHVLSKDTAYVKKYNEAYKKMKALPDTDPRSFKNQWHIHCAFCEGAYLEPGNENGLPLQYHFSWTFLPWHRMYLYFHERILGELIGDPTFTLPFWNWDNQRPVGGNQMPRMFTDNLGNLNSELRNAIRNPEHLPPAVLNLSGTTGSAADVITGNLSILHQAVVSSTSADLFLGGAYTANQTTATRSPGTCETDGHNTVHRWTGSFGNPQYPDNQDMGTFTYSGRDPIFYSHHANVDRLWSVWKTLPVDEATRRGRRSRKESLRPDFRNAQFAFYDQNKRLVHCTVSDSIDTTNLRYKYQEMESDNDWIDFKSTASGVPKPTQEEIQPFAEATTVLSKDEPRTFRLVRREPTDDEIKALDDDDDVDDSDDLEETLVVKGVKVPNNRFLLYKVFVNLPNADENTPLNLFEFVGLITHIPHAAGAGGHDHTSSHGLDFRLSIGAAMKDLQLPVGEDICVTFVPLNQKEDVAFEGVEAEWQL